MDIAVYDPVEVDRTIYVGTDHVWAIRRINGDAPIVPSSAQSQIRSTTTNMLWIECTTEIDPDEGWIYITIPEAQTSEPEWAYRYSGVWDLEVIVDDLKFRWAYGNVRVSHEVTK